MLSAGYNTRMDSPSGGLNQNLARILTLFNQPWKVVLIFNAMAAAATIVVFWITGTPSWATFLFVLVFSTIIGYFASRLLFAYRDMQEERRDQMARVNTELEARYKDLEAFSYSVAHDLKTPLATIIGYTYLLKEHGLTKVGDPVEVANDIEAAAIKMSEIIDSILVLANAGIKQVEPGPIRMDVILENAEKRLEGMIAAHAAEIERPDSWPAAMGYEPWVEEVMVNLISNAIKYGGEPPRLTLGFDSSDGIVRFYVCDNGPGIDVADQDILFTEFTRLEKNRAEGHGLGLAIVRRVVERLGGAYGVESQPGEGSTFYFTLPAA